MQWRNAPVIVAGWLAILAWVIAHRGFRMQAEAARLLSDAMRCQEEAVHVERQAAESVERTAGLSAAEARQLVEARAVERSRAYIAHVVSSAEREAAAEAAKRAQSIMVGALARLTQVPNPITYRNVVTLPDAQGLRARIVGRDGRNLVAFQELTGVQLALREGRPHAVLTSFDPERRAIAEEVLRVLIDEPKVYESTIRKAYDTVVRRWPSRLMAFGREAAVAADAGDLGDEVAALMGCLHFQRLNGVNALSQAVMGARIAAVLSAEVGWPGPGLVVRAAFLRDLGYATGSESGDHAEAGAVTAAQLGEAEAVCQAIRQHHRFSASHRDIASSLVACAERLTVAGTEHPHEAPWLGAVRLRDLEMELERLAGVSSARVLGLATEVSVWVDPEVISEEALQDLTVQAAEVARSRLSKPIAVTVHRHTAWQAPPDASMATPIRWLTDPAAPSIS